MATPSNADRESRADSGVWVEGGHCSRRRREASVTPSCALLSREEVGKEEEEEEGLDCARSRADVPSNLTND